MRLVTTGGRLPSYGGKIIGSKQWVDVGDFTHSWDFRESTIEGNRVSQIEDPVGGLPMRKIPTDFPLLGADIDVYGPLPGPLWIPSSDRFNGRPAARFDPFDVEGTSLFHLFAGLSPNVSADGLAGFNAHPTDSAIYFNPPHGYPQPYWVAVLGRLGLPDDPEAGEDSPAGIFDATHGGVGTGPTIGRKIVGLGAPNWQVSNFGPGLVLITVSHTAISTETVFIVTCVNGASSFLEVTWRDAGGTLNTLRQNGTLLGWNYLECFAGWVHGQYLSAAGVGLGVPAENMLTNLRTWASYFIPPAGALPDEP